MSRESTPLSDNVQKLVDEYKNILDKNPDTANPMVFARDHEHGLSPAEVDVLLNACLDLHDPKN